MLIICSVFKHSKCFPKTYVVVPPPPHKKKTIGSFKLGSFICSSLGAYRVPIIIVCMFATYKFHCFSNKARVSCLCLNIKVISVCLCRTNCCILSDIIVVQCSTIISVSVVFVSKLIVIHCKQKLCSLVAVLSPFNS